MSGRLRSISLDGYRSAAHGKPLVIDRLGWFNIFVGPNNSGKSTVFRFLQVLAELIVNREEHPILLPTEQVDASWWWQSGFHEEIKATIVFESPSPHHDRDPKAPGTFNSGGEWRVSVSIRANQIREGVVLISPEIYVNDAWFPVTRQCADQDSRQFEHLNRTGVYVSSSGSDACPYHAPAREILRGWARSTRFYDPVRAIDREAGRRGLADGSSLLKQIRDQQLDPKQARSFERFRTRLIDELNALLFVPSSAALIEFFEIKGSDRLDLYIKRKGDETPVALQYMGTGVAQLTFLLADLLQNEDTVKQCFLEEPECHLHPGLLRRLMLRLRTFSEMQFLVTTHSSAVLDSTNEDDSIYQFGFTSGSGTSVVRCTDLIAQSKILDALGVSGSALLQTNCAIWVEGPSDRIYLRHWLRVRSRARGLEFIEGSDFSFIFYGGKILSHFAFAEHGSEELVALVRICRFSAVVMDRDIGPTATEAEIRHTKSRIRDEADKDPQHRLALFSNGREIENDVDPDCFRLAVATLLKIDISELRSLNLQGNNRYPDEIIAHLGSTDSKADNARRKLNDKVTLAELVVDSWPDSAPIPAYVDTLLDLIGRSRAIDPSP